MDDKIKKKVAELKRGIINYRRSIHEHPELELDCHQTANLVSKELKNSGLSVLENIANTGLVGILEGSKKNPVIGLRVDMDALPIEELTGLPFASKIEGRMHACGHDGHVAIGLGVAKTLAHFSNHLNGTVKFIFQPGEEHPGGAKEMIRQGVLENPRVDFMFSGHLFPGIKSGQIGIRYGVMTASNDEFTIKLKGKGGHGARPNDCNDPVVATAFLIINLQTIVSRTIDPLSPLVISITEIKSGSGHNVIPEESLLKGTIRSIDKGERNKAIKQLQKILSSLNAGFEIQHELTINEEEPSLECDWELTALTEKILHKIIGKDNVIHIEKPSLGVDDFVFYSQIVPVCYLRIGCYDENKGYVQPLHTPRFDFDENLLLKGVEIFSNIILKCINNYNRPQ